MRSIHETPLTASFVVSVLNIARRPSYSVVLRAAGAAEADNLARPACDARSGPSLLGLAA